MRKDPIWYDGKKKDEYSLAGLRTCKERLVRDIEEVKSVLIVRHYTQPDGASVYSVLVIDTDGSRHNISTSVGAALQREFTWTIDKMRTSWEPLELGRHLAERMALPQEKQGQYERDWDDLQPGDDAMLEVWSRVRILDAYDE